MHSRKSPHRLIGDGVEKEKQGHKKNKEIELSDGQIMGRLKNTKNPATFVAGFFVFTLLFY